jgi:uncharacterized protein (TIRG00374 family)
VKLERAASRAADIELTAIHDLERPAAATDSGQTVGMGGRRGTPGIRLLGLCASVAALWLVLRAVDVGASVALLSRADPMPLIGVLGVLATQVLLRAFRWPLLLPARPGGGNVRVRRVVPVLLVGYLGNAVLPVRLGEPIRALLVARREDLDAAEAFGSVVLERVIDTATLAIVAFVAAFALGAPDWIVRGTGVAAIAGGMLTTALVVVGVGPLVSLVRRLACHLPGADRAEPILARLSDFARGVDRPSQSRVILLAVLVSWACWGFDAVTFSLVARSLGVSINLMAALLIAAVTVLGTALPSAPGYVGTFELAAATTAETLGVAAAPALALAVLAHVLMVLPVAVGGAISLVAMDVRLGRLVQDATGAGDAPEPAVTQP